MWVLACQLGFICSVKSVYAVQINDEVIRSLVSQIEDIQLAEDEIWLALLHYKRETILHRFLSQVDDKRFFLDENGKTDPHAELIADITAFLQPSKAGHAQCLFPARWWWLKQRLVLPDSYDVVCPQLDAFMQRVSHQKLFLVFPSMYLNNPGSTFGHTFLRFDADGESILLSQTLNYAARVDQSDDFISYISKGLFGGYSGFFRARPYYETVQEYNNIENRDIWEYQLNFSPAEIEQLVRHIWEVKGIDFDYYFFRENCSYRLLALLDVMRPGLQLTAEGKFPVYAIPVDTVRALDESKLIKSKKFRASLATQIDDYFSLADDEHSSIILDIVSDNTVAEGTPADSAATYSSVISEKIKSLTSVEDRLSVLEQSYNLLQFSEESSSAKAQAILQLTNELSSKEHIANENITKKSASFLHDSSPDMGHDSLRISSGYGKQNNLHYINLEFRIAFHDLLDAPQGFVDGAAINIFDARLKWFVDNEIDDQIRLESLSLFNVTSLSPVSRWQTPVSWMFDFRLDRTQLSETDSVRNFISRGGFGFSFDYRFNNGLKQKSVMPFILLMGEWNLSSDYDKGYSVLLGLQAGVKVNIHANQLMLSYEIDDAVSGFELDRSIAQLQWQYNLQVNHALLFKYRRTEYDFFDDENWSLNYHYYF